MVTGRKFSDSQATNVLSVHAIMSSLKWNQVTYSEQTLTLGYALKQLEMHY